MGTRWEQGQGKAHLLQRVADGPQQVLGVVEAAPSWACCGRREAPAQTEVGQVLEEDQGGQEEEACKGIQGRNEQADLHLPSLAISADLLPGHQPPTDLSETGR